MTILQLIPVFLSVCILLLSANGASAQPYRINAGGSTFNDSKGNVWGPDTVGNQKYFDIGNAYTTGNAISGTTDDILYQSERWKASTWNFPIANPGHYEVRLHFAEVYGFTTGQRVFDVKIENAKVLDKFDIYAVAGANTAWVEAFPVTVLDGNLEIQFISVLQQPKVCGIEIIPIFELRINAGGSSYTDSQGKVWKADTSFTGGNSYFLNTAIDLTVDDALYQSERWGASTYDIDNIPNGSYELSLHFAEIYSGAKNPGDRLFDVKVQNQLVLDNFDITLKAGAAYKAQVETFPVEVVDGTMLIEFVPVKQQPKISAIELKTLSAWTAPPVPSPTPAPVLPPTPAPVLSPTPSPVLPPSPVSTGTALYRVNAGGSSFVDSKGLTWQADNGFSGGNQYTKPGVSIAGTVDDDLFRSERWYPSSLSSKKYEFTVPNGAYEVRLGFAEVYFNEPGKRVFNVLLEGQKVLEDHDIFATVGGNTADIEVFTTEVSDGKVSILFESVVENPKINTIEILPSSTTALYRINTNGPAFTDDDGRVWSADSYFTGGAVFSNIVASIDTSLPGTTKEILYRTERYKASMSYSFPVDNGMYDVVFHFAEIYDGADEPGQRVFDVMIEGGTVLADFDITAEAGSYTAIAVPVKNIDVNDGKLDVTFGKKVENPKLNGIEVYAKGQQSQPTPAASTPAPVLSPTPSPVLPPSPVSTGTALYRVNAGGSSFVDSKGLTWQADNGFSGGNQYTKPGVLIAGTVDDELFRSERWYPSSLSSKKYEFTVPNGAYEVRLGFAEVYFNEPGKRVFNVLLEGQKVLEDHDIYATVGGNTADIETFTTEVSDGKVSILFESVVENPKINTIEIYSAPPPTPTAPAPTLAASPPGPPTSFPSIYINVGSDQAITDTSTGVTWEADRDYNTGTTGSNSKTISGTTFQQLYRSERYDIEEYPNLIYNISVPDGVFDVTLHFADTYSGNPAKGTGTHFVGARVFDVFIEDKLEIENLDIFSEVGGDAAYVETITTTCNDGYMEIELKHACLDAAGKSTCNHPTLNGIEIHAVGQVKPHFAHAVPGGPYFATDTDNSQNAVVSVDGFYSHTHSAGAVLVSWEWKADGVVVAQGEKADITLGVGEHTLSLTVVDSTGDVSEDTTTATVKPFGTPFIESLTPDSGEMAGGELVTILGSGFTASAANTIVTFGSAVLTGPSQINVVNANTIKVLAVPPASWGNVPVTVQTPIDISNPVNYEYLPLIPLVFTSGNVLTNIFGPTTVAFAPDGSLFVGSQAGDVIRVELDENYNVVSSLTSSAIADAYPPNVYRTILGIVFDPLDDCNPLCSPLVSHSQLFHGDIVNYNGKVSALTGPTLGTVTDIVTGLPVSDHDHGINGLEFDDFGNLYVQVGGNTNAGVEGPLSQSYLQKEDYLSAATLIARGVGDANFNGYVTYDGNGNILPGSDVDVYASGLRNPYDIVYHSSGKLYGTDNGPNLKFGKKSVNCNVDGPEPAHDDKLLLIEEGKYYGHANRKRGETDPRQCLWRDFGETSAGYTGPIRKLPASSNGICEFQSDHFGGALRGELIVGRYKGSLYHVKLTNGGQGAGPVDVLPNVLTEQGGLDVTQGPDGSLFVAKNFGGTVFYQAPDEEEPNLLTVKSVFPRRGHLVGGTPLTIYGQKLFTTGNTPTVTVGGKSCVVSGTKTYTDVNGRTAQWVKVVLPSVSSPTTADVVVSFGGQSYTFVGGYRYITGQPSTSTRRLRRGKRQQ